MPEPAVLQLHTSDGQVLVTWGRTLVYRYEAEDLGMRNLAIVALTDAGRRVDEVAAVFGLTATYVSILRGKARRHGSTGLVGRRRGRPTKLSDRQVARARAWAGQGWTQQAICERLGCARSVVSVLLARLGPTPVQDGLPATSSTEHEHEHESTQSEPDDTEATKADLPVVAEPVAPPAGSAAIGTGSYRCRYAGAMMLFPYLHVVGAQGIFATLTGGPARRYGDLGVLTTATLGFALGAGTQREAQGRRGQHAKVAVPASRATGQRREDPLGADHVQVGEKHHRTGVAASVGTSPDRGRPRGRSHRFGHHGQVGLRRFRVVRLGLRGLMPMLSATGSGQPILHGGRAQPGEQNADHRASTPQAFTDRLLGPPLPGPRPGPGHLAVAELGWSAAAAAPQPRRAVPASLAPQDRHVRRSQPEHRRDLVDPPARVGQRHNRQVAHPQVFGLVAVHQRRSPSHQNLPVTGVQAQNRRFRRAPQLPLIHRYSLPY